MLQNIRDRFTGGFAIAILALISVPFVFFGINYNFIGTGYAAKVNGEEISTFELENAYQNQLLQYAELGELPPAFRRQIKEAVLQNLIRNRLIDMHLREEGFRISDQMVAELIQSIPEFQVDGVFSKDAYYIFLEQRVVDANVFEENQRAGLRQAQLQRAIGATAFVTPAEFRRYLNLYGELRRVAIAVFDTEQVAETIEVTDADVRAYYDERPNDFMTEESADLQYIEINRAILAQTADLTEEEVQSYYEDSASRYRQDEQRQARHILITLDGDEAAAEEQAVELSARAKAGEPFADLARQYSKDGGTAARGGDLGLVMQSQMPGPMGDAIFAMREGEISDPVRSDFGFHVIQLDSIQDGGALPLEQVRAELERELRDQKADVEFRRLENALSDALFDAVDMASMAASTQLELQVATGFTRNGGEPFGANQAAIDAVFDTRVLHDGEISDIVELDANRSAVISVSQYNEAARQSVGEMRDQITSSIKADRARAIIQDQGQQLKAKIESGEDFEAAAAEFQADVTPYMVIDRVYEDVDGRVLEAVFRARKPLQGIPRVGDTLTEDGSHAVFSIDAVAPGRPEAVPLADRDARKEQLAAKSGAADYTAFILQLEADAEVVRSDEALDEDALFQ
jgi:peptidyl-prolyl cis-trans isomerase D